MPCPRIELWLYDTQREMDRAAGEGKVCPRSAVLAVYGCCVVPAQPAPVRHSGPRPGRGDTRYNAVLAYNTAAGIPTQIPLAPDTLPDAADPLLLAATWADLPALLAPLHASGGAPGADQPLTLHYRGFSGPVLPREMPLFPAEFPAQPYPLLAMLRASLRARRLPLPRPLYPFPLGDFRRDDLPGGDFPQQETSGWQQALRGWAVCSALPDRGVFSGERLWEAPLSYRYPRLWVIERRPGLATPYAYTAFAGEKHPGWPALLCHAVRQLPDGGSRSVLVPEDSAPNLAECAVFGRCLGFSVDGAEHRVTVTRDDDARAEFCRALEACAEALRAAPEGFPF